MTAEEYRDRFPVDLETLLATTAAVFKSTGQHDELDVVIHGRASINVRDFDNWNGGTFKWGIKFETELDLYLQVRQRVPAIAEEICRTVNELFFKDSENHTLDAIEILATPKHGADWRTELARSPESVGMALNPAHLRPLRYPAEWKFAAEGVPAAPPELLEELREFIMKMALGAFDPQDLIEDFKAEFSHAAGEGHARSSSQDWAVSDLARAMDAAADNSATFLEAYWVASERLRVRGTVVPPLVTINAVLSKHGSPFTIRPPDLVWRRLDEVASAANPASVVEPSRRPYSERELSATLADLGFELGERIGSGASGIVYRARETALDRQVAVKLCNPTSDKTGVDRFRHEARLLARVQHPSIPYVLRTGEAAGQPFFVMQFVDGRSLRSELELRAKLDVPMACRVARAVLRALDRAHEASVVHRDIKPENILLPTEGEAHLIDFSIGAALEHVPGLTRLTGLANVPGTVDYMAPEVLAGQSWDHRVDVFATGIVLFECCVGRRCSAARLASDLQALPAELAEVVSKACDPVPDRRYASAASFAADLDRFADFAWAPSVTRTGLCPSLTCAGANWEPAYQPAAYPDTTHRCCPTCGSRLSFPCAGCDAGYSGTNHCPKCGRAAYVVPSCSQCCAPLSRAEALGGKDGADGCIKCRFPF